MKKILVMIIAITLLITGCKEKVEDNKDENYEEIEVLSNEEKEEVDYSLVKPNEMGHIMVVMYHGIMDKPPYHRTKEDFIKDLQYMYDNGYRLISIRDYLDNNIDIKAGMTPIVLTFDDSLSSTFHLEEIDGKLVVGKDTAIGIIEDFAKKYPDFGKTATLYINGWENGFDGAGTLNQRLNWLVENGYEIGNHTYKHFDLSKLSKEELIEEVGYVDRLIKKSVTGYKVDSITYPFGKKPKEENLEAIKEGRYLDTEYQYQVGFREGPSGTFYSPLHINFASYNAPRVRGSEGEQGDLWWYFDFYEKNSHLKYISDGKKNLISIPMEYEAYLDKDKIGNKELIVY